MGGGENVFGKINTEEPVAITVALLVLLGVIIIIDFIMKNLEEMAEKYNVEEIFRKLVEELMVLGWISFLITLTSAIAGGNEAIINSKYYIALSMADIIILFIAFSFILEALILVKFSRGDGIQFLKSVRVTEEELNDKLNNVDQQLQNSKASINPINEMSRRMSSLKTRETHEILIDTHILAPKLSSSFFTQIEFKLMHELFVKCHNFPIEFDFGTYMGYQLNKFISKIGETSSVTWFCLGLVFALNYVRTLVDNSAESYECRNQSLNQCWGCDGHCETSTSSNNAHRFLSSNSWVSPDLHCYLFFFSYAFFCSCLLNLSIYGVYYASCYYETAMAMKAIDVLFPVTDTTNSILSEKVQMVNNKNKSKCSRFFIPSYFDNEKELCIMALRGLIQQKEFKDNNNQDGIKISKFVANQNQFKNQHSHKRLLMKEQSTLNHKRKKTSLIILFFKSFIKLFDCFRQHHKQEELVHHPSIDISDIFWLKWPTLYFWMLNFVTLLQSVYLALYFTQLLPLAISSKHPGWGVALTIMPIIGGIILYFTLRRAVLLYAMSKLDPQVSGRVFEEMKIVSNLANDIRLKIDNIFAEELQLNTPQDKMDFIKIHLDPDNSNVIDRAELLIFLDEIEIYLSKERFDLLWNLVDYDLSGYVTLDEILIFLFPDMKTLLRKELKLVEAIRIKFKKLFKIQNMNNDIEMKTFLQEHFNKYDVDDSGCLDKNELRNMIESLNIKIENDHIFHLLMAVTEVNNDGHIEFSSFANLVMSVPIEECNTTLRPIALST